MEEFEYSDSGEMIVKNQPKIKPTRFHEILEEHLGIIPSRKTNRNPNPDTQLVDNKMIKIQLEEQRNLITSLMTKIENYEKDKQRASTKPVQLLEIRGNRSSLNTLPGRIDEEDADHMYK